jgi:hypothetical protein
MSAPRCYTIADLLIALKVSRRNFYRMRQSGAAPFLEEIKPRLGRMPRYRADLVDRYLANEWISRRGQIRKVG